MVSKEILIQIKNFEYNMGFKPNLVILGREQWDNLASESEFFNIANMIERENITVYGIEIVISAKETQLKVAYEIE